MNIKTIGSKINSPTPAMKENLLNKKQKPTFHIKTKLNTTKNK